MMDECSRPHNFQVKRVSSQPLLTSSVSPELDNRFHLEVELSVATSERE